MHLLRNFKDMKPFMCIGCVQKQNVQNGTEDSDLEAIILNSLAEQISDILTRSDCGTELGDHHGS